MCRVQLGGSCQAAVQRGIQMETRIPNELRRKRAEFRDSKGGRNCKTEYQRWESSMEIVLPGSTKGSPWLWLNTNMQLYEKKLPKLGKQKKKQKNKHLNLNNSQSSWRANHTQCMFPPASVITWNNNKKQHTVITTAVKVN